MSNVWNWSNFFFGEFRSYIHIASHLCHLQACFLFCSPCWNCRQIRFFKRLADHFTISQQFHQLRPLLPVFKFRTTCSIWPFSFKCSPVWGSHQQSVLRKHLPPPQLLLHGSYTSCLFYCTLRKWMWEMGLALVFSRALLP